MDHSACSTAVRLLLATIGRIVSSTRSSGPHGHSLWVDRPGNRSVLPGLSGLLLTGPQGLVHPLGPEGPKCEEQKSLGFDRKDAKEMTDTLINTDSGSNSKNGMQTPRRRPGQVDGSAGWGVRTELRVVRESIRLVRQHGRSV
jgi:hypothetical protein